MSDSTETYVSFFDVTSAEPDAQIVTAMMTSVPRAGETFELDVQMFENHKMSADALAAFKAAVGVYRVVLVEHVHIVRDWNVARQYVRVYLHKNGRPSWHNVRRNFVAWCKSLGA